MKRFVAICAVLLLAVAPLWAEPSSWVNGLSYQGQDITCDLPASQHIRNIDSHVDGAGMCVMSSIEMAARWAGLEQLRGLRDWCANERGGGYPQKVDDQLARFFKAKKITPVPYLQFEGRNPEALLELIDKTGRMAAITYGYSPRYGGGGIAHMTCCPMYRGKYAVCLDNNFPGDDKYEWMLKEELVRRIRSGSGSGWVFCWLPPGPPPSPKNKG